MHTLIQSAPLISKVGDLFGNMIETLSFYHAVSENRTGKNFRFFFPQISSLRGGRIVLKVDLKIPNTFSNIQDNKSSLNFGCGNEVGGLSFGVSAAITEPALTGS